MTFDQNFQMVNILLTGLGSSGIEKTNTFLFYFGVHATFRDLEGTDPMTHQSPPLCAVAQCCPFCRPGGLRGVSAGPCTAEPQHSPGQHIRQTVGSCHFIREVMPLQTEVMTLLTLSLPREPWESPRPSERHLVTECCTGRL